MTEEEHDAAQRIGEKVLAQMGILEATNKELREALNEIHMLAYYADADTAHVQIGRIENIALTHITEPTS